MGSGGQEMGFVEDRQCETLCYSEEEDVYGELCFGTTIISV